MASAISTRAAYTLSLLTVDVCYVITRASNRSRSPPVDVLYVVTWASDTHGPPRDVDHVFDTPANVLTRAFDTRDRPVDVGRVFYTVTNVLNRAFDTRGPRAVVAHVFGAPANAQSYSCLRCDRPLAPGPFHSCSRTMLCGPHGLHAICCFRFRQCKIENIPDRSSFCMTHLRMPYLYT